MFILHLPKYFFERKKNLYCMHHWKINIFNSLKQRNRRMSERMSKTITQRLIKRQIKLLKDLKSKMHSRMEAPKRSSSLLQNSEYLESSGGNHLQLNVNPTSVTGQRKRFPTLPLLCRSLETVSPKSICSSTHNMSPNDLLRLQPLGKSLEGETPHQS